MQEEWYAHLPPELMRDVYRRGNELAWSGKHARRVVDWLQAQGYAVSRIETWLDSPTGLMPLIDDWTATRNYPAPPFPITVQRFVADFAGFSDVVPKDGERILFNITATRQDG